MEMSITRALNQLKLLDKRINKGISDLKFVAAAKKSSNKVLVTQTKEEFISSQLAKYQSVTDLMELRKEIKTKIVQSNATTIVTIGEKEYTVADAIERKNSLQYDKQIVMEMKSRLDSVNYTVNRQNEAVEEKAFELLQTLVGKENAKNVKIDDQQMTKDYLENNSYELIDPLKIEELIEKKSSEIDIFENNIDYVLSESNAITKITISQNPDLV